MSEVGVSIAGGSRAGGSKAPGLLGTELTAKEKAAERMKKLRDLHLKRNEARSELRGVYFVLKTLAPPLSGK